MQLLELSVCKESHHLECQPLHSLCCKLTLAAVTSYSLEQVNPQWLLTVKAEAVLSAGSPRVWVHTIVNGLVS